MVIWLIHVVEVGDDLLQLLSIDVLQVDPICEGQGLVRVGAATGLHLALQDVHDMLHHLVFLLLSWGG
jgi:hypothetical protein